MKVRTGEAAWVAASCVDRVEGGTKPAEGGEPSKQELALKAAQDYEKHNKTNEAPIGSDKVGDTDCPWM